MNQQTQRRRNARQTKRTSLRAITFGIIVILVLGTAGYLIKSGLSPDLPAPAEGVIDVTADMGGFNRQEIRVKAGEPVTLRLTSLDTSAHTDGGGKHQWAIDELGVSVVAPPKGSESASFTPDKPGVYTFYCDICCGGRANSTMQGKLIVEA